MIKSSSAARHTRRRLGNTSTCLYDVFWHINKSPSVAGHTRRRPGNTSTCLYGEFWHINKSSTVAGCTRRGPGNTSTCLYGAFRHIIKSSSTAGHMHHMDKCLCCQADRWWFCRIYNRFSIFKKKGSIIRVSSED